MATAAPVQSVTGTGAPALKIDPTTFFKLTRRMRFSAQPAKAISAIGSSDTVELRKAGVISALIVRVSGTVTVATADPTAWLYDMGYNIVKQFRLSANGQSNLISCRGITIRAHELASNPKLTDNATSMYYAGTAYTSGTLGLKTDVFANASGDPNPGAASGAHAPTAYSIDLSFVLPIASDPFTLTAAIYGQSQSTNLNLEIQWNTEAALCTVGTAALTWALTYSVDQIAYSIPQVGGTLVVPSINWFHQLVETPQGGLVQNDNEVKLPGTGPGRQLQRLLFQVTRTSTLAGNPLAVNATNYNKVTWAYGGATQPEYWANGTQLAQQNERETGCWLGRLYGIGLVDFVSENRLRDPVDLGAASDVRMILGLAAAPTAGTAFVTQEILAPVTVSA
jgi:hypothetical protein